MTTTDGRGGIDADLVARLVASQFPQWAGLPIRPVERDGWDNRTYRLGNDLSVRLPSHASYAAAVAKEQAWLRLAPCLPLQTFLPDRARPVFRAEVGLDDATWARARGWALWKALLGLVDGRTHVSRSGTVALGAGRARGRPDRRPR